MNAAVALQLLAQPTVFGKSVRLFDGAPRTQLALFGVTRPPSVAGLFVAAMQRTYEQLKCDRPSGLSV